MSIAKWVDQREMTGFMTFSYQEVLASFPSLTTATVSNELYRMKKKRRIQSVHKGYYAIVPMPFRDKGIVPPYHYIDQLMAYLDKPYYISLSSAGVLHGAAHQRPQKLSIMTTLPRITFSKDSNKHLFWNYRKEIPEALLCKTNSETGTILYSNVELTAVDLVQYNHLAGGLSAVSTIIEELAEATDFRQWGEALVKVTTLPTLQRLGYILDEVLENSSQADAIYDILHPHVGELKYRPLSKKHPMNKNAINTRWKIFVNHLIEPDEWS